MKISALRTEWRRIGVQWRCRDIQPNQWVALLYFESQKASRTGQTGAKEEGSDGSGVAASPFIFLGPQGAVRIPTAPVFEGSDFEEEKSLALRRRGGTGIRGAGGMWFDNVFCGKSAAAQRIDEPGTDRGAEPERLVSRSADLRRRFLRHQVQLQPEGGRVLHLRVLGKSADHDPEHA